MKVIKSGTGTEELRRAIRDLEQRQARVGFFEHSQYPDGTPVAYVASIQEFGYGAIPPRPFFRPVTEAQKPNWTILIGKGAIAVMEGRTTVDNMLEQFGQAVAGAVKEEISKVNSPPLALSTLVLRKKKKDGTTIGGKVVGETVRDVNFVGPRAGGALPDISGVSTKPLVDTGYMISQVNNDVVNK